MDSTQLCTSFHPHSLMHTTQPSLKLEESSRYLKTLRARAQAASWFVWKHSKCQNWNGRWRAPETRHDENLAPSRWAPTSLDLSGVRYWQRPSHTLGPFSHRFLTLPTHACMRWDTEAPVGISLLIRSVCTIHSPHHVYPSFEKEKYHMMLQHVPPPRRTRCSALQVINSRRHSIS